MSLHFSKPFKLWAGILLILASPFSGCKKFVTIDPPPTSISEENVYKDDATATGVVTQLYGLMSSDGYGFSGNQLGRTHLAAGLLSDELTLFSTSDNDLLPFYTNTIAPELANPGPWNEIWSFIYTTNSVIEGVSGNSSLTPVVSKQLLGEAKFLRAYYNFYLVNFYGKIPLVISTDAKKNALLPRASIDDVYAQIIKDLVDAEALLSTNYLSADLKTVSVDKVRPTKWAAAALLARAYLYKKDYANAYAQSNLVIGSNAFQLSSLNSTFLKNSQEAIWQLQPVGINQQANTPEGFLFILPATGPDVNNYKVYMSNGLANSFEVGDQRKTDWVGKVIVGADTYYFPYKYKSDQIQNAVITEYEMMLRLGEQYLIRAEAQANGAGAGINGAISDLNLIRQRAGLPDYAGAINKDAIMAALLHERQVELFTEWGHRWFDLKRWPGTTLRDIMTPTATLKGGTWDPSNFQALLPIQRLEILHDPNLDQNPGYQ